MMSLDAIVAVNREAAEHAAEEGHVPFVLTPEDLAAARRGLLLNLGIPTLGAHVPAGWSRVDLQEWFPSLETGSPGGYMYGVDYGMNAFFVDHSGFGSTTEPALTLPEFFAMARPGFGYGVIETGQLQLYIGVFQQVRTEPVACRRGLPPPE